MQQYKKQPEQASPPAKAKAQKPSTSQQAVSEPPHRPAKPQAQIASPVKQVAKPKPAAARRLQGLTLSVRISTRLVRSARYL